MKTLAAAFALGLTLAAVPMTATAADGQNATVLSLPNCGHSNFNVYTSILYDNEDDDDFYHRVYYVMKYYCYECGYIVAAEGEFGGYEAHEYEEPSPEEMWHCYKCGKDMNF